MCSSNGRLTGARAGASAGRARSVIAGVDGPLVTLAHQREQYDIPNRWTVRQKHDQSIDPDAFAAGRGKAVLERADVVLVHLVRLEVAARAVPELRLETAPLLHRIVQ